MKKILIICGPTATGKTALALSLAKKFNGELVSADSRQIYKEMDIGTGKDFPNGEKIRTRELSIAYQKKIFTVPSYDFTGVPLWMYDVVNPDEEFTVSHYQHLGNTVIDDIIARKKLPIIVGGTGLYIAALLEKFSTTDIPPNPLLREELSVLPVEALQKKLQTLAPDIFISLNNSDLHNPRRLIRKIELVTSGVSHHTDKQRSSVNSLWVGLRMNMERLEQRIALRVDKRINDGQLQEVQALKEKGYPWTLPSMSGLGYIQWKDVDLHHDITGPQFITGAMKVWITKEVQYVKRQMTWFKKNASIKWFDAQSEHLTDQVEQEVSPWYTKSGA